MHHFPSLLDVIVKNTKIFGGEWIFDPNAESDDGRFELVPVTGRRDFGAKLLGTMRHVPVGMDDLEQLGIEHAPAIAGTQARARRAQPKAASCPPRRSTAKRSQPAIATPIDVVPRALRLIVPREHVDLGIERRRARVTTVE